MTKKQNKTIVAGALILAVSNLLVKAIGLLFKIPLSGIIDPGDTGAAEGMAYFNAAYTLYSWFYVVSTAGLPVAISLMVSESRAKGRYRESRRIFAVTAVLLTVIGLIGSSVMLFGAGLLGDAIGNHEALHAIRAIAPTLLFICIASAFRGYFQGNQNMLPTAVSQLIEALGKLVLGLLFATYAVKRGYGKPTVAAYAIFGLTVGAAVGMLYLFLTKWLSDRRKEDSEPGTEDCREDRKLLRSIVAIAVPVTVSASVMSVTNLFDVLLIMRRLTGSGVLEDTAKTLYGNYTTLAVPMHNLPTALIYPISYSITPAIAAHLSAGRERDAKAVVQSALKVSAIITVPASLGLATFSKPILSMFFARAKVEMTWMLLSVLAMSVFFVGIMTVINAVLQAYKHERKPIIAMASGAAVKLITSAVLMGIPFGAVPERLTAIGIPDIPIQMYGAPVGTFLCYLTITAVDLVFLVRFVKVIPRFGAILGKPMLAAVPAVGGALLLYRLTLPVLQNAKATVVGILAAVVLYFVLLLLFRGVNEEEIRLIPGGGKVYRVLCKLRLMK